MITIALVRVSRRPYKASPLSLSARFNGTLGKTRRVNAGGKLARPSLAITAKTQSRALHVEYTLCELGRQPYQGGC
jgi:hypothetical protein